MPAEDSEPVTKADVKVLKDDVKVLKGDVKVLKGDVKVLKGDVKVLKDDVRVIKTDIKALEATTSRIAKDQVRLGGEFRGMEERFVERLSDFKSELLQAFEESVVKGKRYDDKALTHGDQLQDHEKRLSALEPPRTG